MLTPYQSIVSLTPLVSSAHPHLARLGLLLRSIVTTAIETIVSGLVCGTVSVTKSRGSAISFDSRVTKLVRAASILPRRSETVKKTEIFKIIYIIINFNKLWSNKKLKSVQ